MSPTLTGSMLLALLALCGTAEAGEWRASGFAAVELRWFVEDPQFADQFHGGQGSLVGAPEWDWDSSEGRHQISVAPFVRLDGRDDERSHFDLREAYWRRVWDDWELLVGVNQVFWGVTESRHLVDVINQRDLVDDVDEEDKLGQPMVQVVLQRGWGRLEGFALLGFRERTFPGREGRLRAALPVDTESAVYESGAGQWHLDGALRYSHYIGDWDIGAHLFQGTNREPRLLPDPGGSSLIPFYDLMKQAGVDVQYTRGAWLWKLEGLVREGRGETFGAAVAGFEYTFYQVGKSVADVGLLAEYLYDGRDAGAPPTAFDDDLFVGSRLALNDTQDTQILAGAIVDREDRSTAAFLEAERRIGESYKIELESRLFLDVDEANLLSSFAQDSFILLRLSRYF
jgi:hypothetical protein